jgi:hypothetical protein
MKTIIITLLLSSFVFSGVSFNKGIAYGSLDATVTVAQTMGVDFDLNDKMSLGYDTGIGMLVKADGPLGLSIRIGINGTDDSTLGVGYNWWSGGETIKTSIGTVLDYTSDGTDDETTVRINIGWGF